jgi:sterol desaturase/sphingolipid hydroxylase (fatty acid hydroxylase superfamily)
MHWSESGDALAVSLGISLLLVGLLLAETVSPLRRAVGPTARRWMINAALYLFSIVIAAVLIPEQWTGGLGAIAWVERTFGSPASLLLGVLLLDLLFYALHRLEHASDFLWRLHMVHHSDIDVDVTTAVRHHPGESLVNCLALGTLTVLSGIPPATIALYGSLALAAQMLQHANLAWPDRAEHFASLLIITPGLHRRHHSEEHRVSNTNFGLVFSLWDRLFRTLDSRSSVAGFGVQGLGRTHCRTLWAILVLPLARRLPGDNSPAE